MSRQPNFGTPIAFGLILAALVIGYFDYTSSSGRTAADRKLLVKGTASRSVEADRAIWKGRTINESSSLSRVHQSVEKDRKVLASFIKDRGFDSSRISFASIELRRDPSGPGTRYTAIQKFRLKGEDLNRIRSCAREAGSLMARGLSVQNISVRYHYELKEEKQKMLLQGAATDARGKAQAIADTSDVSLGGLFTLKEGALTLNGKEKAQGRRAGPMKMSSPKGQLHLRVEATFNLE